MKKLLMILLILLFTGCIINLEDETKNDEYMDDETEKLKNEFNIDKIKDFSEFLDILKEKDIEKRGEIFKKLEPVLLKKFSYPIMRDRYVEFIYIGEENTSIELVGDINNWSRNGKDLEKIEGTDIFYIKMPLENNARIKYKFEIDNNKEVLDPLNKYVENSTFGSDSVLEMPGYYYPSTDYNNGIKHGKMEVKRIINNTIFGSPDDERKVQIYLPNGYSETKKYKTLYFCDGSDYVEKSKIPNVLDYMIAKNEIEPVVGVFIDWIDRDAEYIESTKSDYLKFLLYSLIPMLESEYSLDRTREGRVAVGPSNGGVFVTYVGAVAHDKFKYIFNQSGAPYFGYEGNFGSVNEFGDNYISQNIPIKVFSQVGKYEKNYNIQSATKFHEYLKENEHIIDEKLVFYPQGHTYRMWGDGFREGIKWLLDN